MKNLKETKNQGFHHCTRIVSPAITFQTKPCRKHDNSLADKSDLQVVQNYIEAVHGVTVTLIGKILNTDTYLIKK